MDPVLRELERLKRANGGILLAEKVVAAARDEDSPLHGRFVWDDAEAAHQHRLDVARGIIAHYKVVIREQPRETKAYEIVTAPLFSRRPGITRGYVSTLDLLAGPERRPLLLQEFDRCVGHVSRLLEYFEAASMSQTVKRWQRFMNAERSRLEALPEAEAGH